MFFTLPFYILCHILVNKSTQLIQFHIKNEFNIRDNRNTKYKFALLEFN